MIFQGPEAQCSVSTPTVQPADVWHITSAQWQQKIEARQDIASTSDMPPEVAERSANLGSIQSRKGLLVQDADITEFPPEKRAKVGFKLVLSANDDQMQLSFK